MASTIADRLRLIDMDSFESEVERKDAVNEARALLSRLETPMETAFRLVWIHPTLMAAIRTAMQLGLFEKWKATGAQAMAEDELQKLCPCDTLLLRRMLRHLASNQILNIIGPGTYSMAPFGAALADVEMGSIINMYYDFKSEIFLNLPGFLQNSDYRHPTDPINGVWKATKGSDLMTFLKANPKIDSNLMTCMKVTSTFRGSLVQDYPVEALINRADPDTVLLVDVGGSLGHDIAALQHKYPQPKGKLILQDRPEVLEMSTELPAVIEKIAHDFFTPQPVKGAAAYYMHQVMHDFPDAQCVEIMQNLKPAMKKGYSKLLIHEISVDSTCPSAEATTCDITMMGMVAGMERSDEDWRQLFETGGFKLTNTIQSPLSMCVVMEVEPM